jgi:hypothetical protein
MSAETPDLFGHNKGSLNGSQPRTRESQLKTSVVFRGNSRQGENVSKNMDRKILMSALAEDLDDYLRFRADAEGVSYKLSPEFFTAHIKMGVASYFGVDVDLAYGVLVQDRQEPRPGFFEGWVKSKIYPV